MIDFVRVADDLAAHLSVRLGDLPAGFLDSFDFTRTGKNLTHPIVLGLLARAVQELPDVAFVGIDVRLNLGLGVKFQPDLVAFGEGLEPVLMVDYESPNSSDWRVPTKDVDAYRAWSAKRQSSAPYLIVTTLPDRPSPAWELRWTSPGYCNARFRGQGREVRENPFRFWYAQYEAAFRSRDMTNVALINIDGTRAVRAVPNAT